MRSKLFILGMGGLLLLAATAGCSREQAAETKQAVPEQAALPPSAASNLDLPLAGRIAEVFESSGYSYLRLETANGEQWVATGTNGFAQGESISILDGQLMENFYSRSLDRTFPEIIFASSLSGEPKGESIPQATAGEPAADSFAAALRSEHSSGASPGMNGMGAMGGVTGGMGRIPAEVPLSEIKVEKAEGKNAYRVAELHQGASELNGKEVTVRGKVMKVSAQIMGRNWLHLQDGSGETASGTHNLVVTTEAMPVKGEVITIKGIFQANKDIGAGYRYAALVEHAQIMK